MCARLGSKKKNFMENIVETDLLVQYTAQLTLLVTKITDHLPNYLNQVAQFNNYLADNHLSLHITENCVKRITMLPSGTLTDPQFDVACA
jgi:hypothetical protein